MGLANDQLKIAHGRAQAGAAVFIQSASHREELVELHEMLEESLKRAADGKSLFIAPILDTFAELFASNENMNSDSIGAAITAIDGLIKHFGQGLVLLDSTYKTESAALTKKIVHHDAIILNLEKTLLPAKTLEMTNNTTAQASKKGQKIAAEADLKVEEDNKDDEEASFAQRSTLHDDLMAEFKKELEIVKKANGILRKAAGVEEVVAVK